MKSNPSDSFALVVEDHPLVAESLVGCVRENAPDLHVAIAESLAEALSILRQRPAPALILTDLTLTDATGVDAVRRLREAAPKSPLLVVTALDLPALREEAKAFGAIDYLIKNTSIQMLRDRIRTILGCHQPKRQATAKRASPLRHVFTPKQIQVLEELVAGRSNKQIAARLEISDETVGSHMKAILGKLAARNRTEAVVRYLQIIHPAKDRSAS